MSRKLFALLVAMLVMPVFALTSQAAPHRKAHYSKSYSSGHKSAHRSYHGNRRASSSRRASSRRHASRPARSYRRNEDTDYGRSSYTSYSSNRSSVGGRPGRWCGWWMRTQRGGGPEMNLAWNWRKYGSPGSPQVGAVVVWRHHVGQIVGQAANGKWLVQSGNDGNAVRTRPRSISGAVIRI